MLSISLELELIRDMPFFVLGYNAARCIRETSSRAGEKISESVRFRASSLPSDPHIRKIRTRFATHSHNRATCIRNTCARISRRSEFAVSKLNIDPFLLGEEY